MSIRCHAQHDGLGIALSQIESAETATGIRNFFVERGVGAIVTEAASPANHRIFVAMTSVDSLRKLIAGTTIVLID